MRVTADTNILVRIIVRDHPSQARAALDILEAADLVFVPLPCLCEFAWVLGRTYDLPRRKIVAAIRAIVERANVSTDLPPIMAGLRMLDAGGDFADGAIAAAGAAMGAETFVSFDRKAVKHLVSTGIPARHVGEVT